MKPVGTIRAEDQPAVRPDDRRSASCHLDEQLGELIETVLSCGRQWTVDDRIDAVIRYGSR